MLSAITLGSFQCTGQNWGGMIKEMSHDISSFLYKKLFYIVGSLYMLRWKAESATPKSRSQWFKGQKIEKSIRMCRIRSYHVRSYRVRISDKSLMANSDWIESGLPKFVPLLFGGKINPILLLKKVLSKVL